MRETHRPAGNNPVTTGWFNEARKGLYSVDRETRTFPLDESMTDSNLSTSASQSPELPDSRSPTVLRWLPTALGLTALAGLAFAVLPHHLRLLGLAAAALGAVVAMLVGRQAAPPFAAPHSCRICAVLLAVVAFGLTSGLWFRQHVLQVTSSDTSVPELYAMQAAQSLTSDPELAGDVSEELTRRLSEAHAERIRGLTSLTGFLAHRSSALTTSPTVGWLIWIAEFVIAAAVAAWVIPVGHQSAGDASNGSPDSQGKNTEAIPS